MRVIFSKKDIKEFQKMGIEIVYLFGSEAQNRTQPMSDVDIGLVFSQPEKIKDKASVFKGLYKLFSRIFPLNKEIDVVFLQFTPLNIQISAVQTGEVLYQKNQAKRYEYEEYTLKQYLDFKPYLERFNQAVLSRV